MEFEESSKSIRWRALMETYQTAKFDRSLKNLSGDIVLTDQCPEQTKKKKKNSSSAFACRSKSVFSFAAWTRFSGGYMSIRTTTRGAAFTVTITIIVRFIMRKGKCVLKLGKLLKRRKKTLNWFIMKHYTRTNEQKSL